MMSEKVKTIIVSPSLVLTGGLKAVLARSEFVVEECYTSVPAETDASLVLIDPVTADYSSVFGLDAPVAAVIHSAYDRESLSHFDVVINIYDPTPVVLRKLRKIVSSAPGEETASDGGELSPREKEILVCVAKGMLNKEIAFKYNISIFTVMTHRKNISAKTGIKSIAGLTAYAILQGMIDIEDIK